jgi:hypothetical protein
MALHAASRPDIHAVETVVAEEVRNVDAAWHEILQSEGIEGSGQPSPEARFATVGSVLHGKNSALEPVPAR